MTSVLMGNPTGMKEKTTYPQVVCRSGPVNCSENSLPAEAWNMVVSQQHARIFSFSWHEKFPKSRDFSSVHQKISPAPHNIQSDVVLSRERLPKHVVAVFWTLVAKDSMRSGAPLFLSVATRGSARTVRLLIQVWDVGWDPPNHRSVGRWAGSSCQKSWWDGCSQVGYRQAEVAETISFFQSFNVSFLLTCIYFRLYQLCEFWPSRFSATCFFGRENELGVFSYLLWNPFQNISSVSSKRIILDLPPPRKVPKNTRLKTHSGLERVFFWLECMCVGYYCDLLFLIPFNQDRWYLPWRCRN